MRVSEQVGGRGSDRLRIGLLTPAWPGNATPNGIATTVRTLSEGLKEIGHSPIIIAMRIDGTPPEDTPFLEVKRRQRGIGQKILSKLGRSNSEQALVGDSIADAVETAASRYELDILIMEETHGWARQVQARGAVPVVVKLSGPWFVHTEFSGNKESQSDIDRIRREKWAYLAADALIAPSRSVFERVEQRVNLGGKPKRVVANAIAMRPRVNRSPNSEILFVGRFDNTKGGDILLDAFARLVQRRPQARLSFVGPDKGVRLIDGRRISISEKLAEFPAEVVRAIRVFGARSATEVAELRTQHALAVIASRYDNLPHTVLEAMVAGQAIVCTRVGGPAEILEDGRTALLVPPEDPDAMADALARLLDEPALAQRIGQAARLEAETTFDPQNVASKTVDFMRSIIRER